MPFKVKATKWLEIETNRVESQILMRKYESKEWTPESLKDELDAVGLDYTEDQLTLIHAELVRRKIVENV